MITEELVKKVAKQILGGESGWYFSLDPGFGMNMMRITLNCPHCQAEHHVVYDKREPVLDVKRMSLIKLPKKI